MKGISDLYRVFLRQEKGSTFLLVFFAVGLLAALTAVFFRQTDAVPVIRSSVEIAAQTDQILSHATTLRTAVQNIINNGIDPANINDIIPSDAGFSTAPHTEKIYHPFGGGVTYYEDFQGWNNIVIHTNARITNVGPSTTAEIMAVGLIEEQALCQSINERLLGVTTITTVQDASFNNLEGGTAITLLDDTTVCTTGICNERAFQCITNVSNDEYLFYNVLHAR